MGSREQIVRMLLRLMHELWGTSGEGDEGKVLGYTEKMGGGAHDAERKSPLVCGQT